MPPRRRARAADQNADDSEEQDADGKFQVRVPVKAGPRVLTATFVRRRPPPTKRSGSRFCGSTTPRTCGSWWLWATSRFPVRSTRCLPATRLAGAASSHVRRRTLPARTAPATSSRRWRSAPSGARESVGPRRTDGRLQRRAGGARIRGGHRTGPAAHPREPALSVSCRAGRAARRGERTCHSGSKGAPHQRSRAGVPAVVLPVEQHPGRRRCSISRRKAG